MKAFEAVRLVLIAPFVAITGWTLWMIGDWVFTYVGDKAYFNRACEEEVSETLVSVPIQGTLLFQGHFGGLAAPYAKKTGERVQVQDQFGLKEYRFVQANACEGIEAEHRRNGLDCFTVEDPVGPASAIIRLDDDRREISWLSRYSKSVTEVWVEGKLYRTAVRHELAPRSIGTIGRGFKGLSCGAGSDNVIWVERLRSG